jgi:hypothetical protein
VLSFRTLDDSEEKFRWQEEGEEIKFGLLSLFIRMAKSKKDDVKQKGDLKAKILRLLEKIWRKLEK